MRNVRFGIGWVLAVSLVSPSWAEPPKGLSPRVFSFVDLVKRQKATVVNITVERSSGGKTESRTHPFGDLFNPEQGSDGQSMGSGFIVRKDGLLLTNHHVVSGAGRITVKLWDGRELTAGVLGSDEKTDIALLKITQTLDLPAVVLGDSERLEVGEWVLAIGNPFGLEQTVTVGIVSAKGRTINMGPYDDYIQTDASINPGNSGGPLFNIRGEVVGINTAINPAGQGIGFAIPINIVKKIMASLETEGHVTRGWLGVIIREVDKELSASSKIHPGEGAVVNEVFENSPAARAGIKAGDVILEYDGKKVGKMRELPTLVADTPVGKEIRLRTIREGKERWITLTIGRMPEDDELKEPEDKK
jgi:serine protease Do